VSGQNVVYDIINKVSEIVKYTISLPVIHWLTRKNTHHWYYN